MVRIVGGDTKIIARNKPLGIKRRVAWWDQGWVSRIAFHEWVWGPSEWKDTYHDPR